ncbi:DUF1097 domain-containing protein [Microbulbifer magnicolonia]|uniref:DUF1097 domain-containing protein n=1 Tax=Microbulbifer magnicolonia TaxID=3109744 RepID=UPI002B41169B|nr:DUF1097 domain-containing protein [Microbulbifer sp. GG15]
MSQAMVSEHTTESVSVSVSRSPVKLRSALEIAGAAGLSLFGGLPVWITLSGWLAYRARGSSLRDGAYNLACAVTGLGLGIVAQAAAVKLHPALGLAALPAALALAAVSALMMNWITGVKNIPSYLIGIVVVFAAGMDTSLDTYLILTAAVSVGAFAAALADFIHQVREPEVQQ